jgi:antitoxin YefM
MVSQTTYAAAQSDLAALLDRVHDQSEIVVIKRRGGGDVALVPIDELSGLLETAHLLRSPANRRRLVTALNRALTKNLKTQSPESLKREIGLEKGSAAKKR